MIRTLSAFAAWLGLLILLPAPARAVSIVLDAVDAGFVNVAGRSAKNDGVILGSVDATFNYSAGAIDEVPPLAGTDVPRKNYFTFDLSSVGAPIVAAELHLFEPVGGYASPDTSETYVLGGTLAADSAEMAAVAADLASVLSILVPPELALASALYGKVAETLDTMAAPEFGSVDVSAADDGTTVVVPLTPDGIAYLNGFAGGPVILGGLVATLDGVDAGDEVVFGFTKPLIPGVLTSDPPIVAPTPTPTLVLTLVPEPGTAVLVGLGIAWLAAGARARARA